MVTQIPGSIKQGLILTDLPFVRSYVRMFSAHYGVGLHTPQSFAEAMKYIEQGDVEYLIMEVPEDHLLKQTERQLIMDFIRLCQSHATELKANLQIIIVTAASRELYGPLIEANVDYILHKDHEWYKKLASIYYSASENKTGKSQAAVVKKMFVNKAKVHHERPKTVREEVAPLPLLPDDDDQPTGPSFTHTELMGSPATPNDTSDTDPVD